MSISISWTLQSYSRLSDLDPPQSVNVKVVMDRFLNAIINTIYISLLTALRDTFLVGRKLVTHDLPMMTSHVHRKYKVNRPGLTMS